MPLIPVKMKPGIFRNGTRYQAKGRWHSANRIRWHDGAMRPIGGWSPMVDQGTGDPTDSLVSPGNEDVEFFRDGYTWRTNSKDQVMVYGSNYKAVHVYTDGSQWDDISPAGFPTGPARPVVPTGYGSGYYGRGSYGLSEDSVTDPVVSDVGRWKFDNWGQTLLAMADWDGKIYYWTPGVDLVMLDLAAHPSIQGTPPTAIQDFAVTGERMVMAIGGTGDLRRVEWCDQEDFTDWRYDEVTNQAGFFNIPGKGLLLGIYRLNNQMVILSESDAWVARYVGPPYVYSFEKVADHCTPVHKTAVVEIPGAALVWPGERNFWMFDGQVQRLESDLIDFLVADISTYNATKSFGWPNVAFNEVWFHYASVNDPPVDEADAQNIEPARYVSWNWSTNAWSQGQLPRSCAVPQGVFSRPHMVDLDGSIYLHEEVGVVYDDNIRSVARTGPLELGEGDANMAISALYPDSQIGNWSSDAELGEGVIEPAPVNFFFEGRQMPMGPVVQSAVYDLTATPASQPVATRFLARDIMLTLAGNEGALFSTDWEWGDFRLDVVPTGTGKR